MLVALESEISRAESAGLRTRWEFGRQLLMARNGKRRLPNGYLAAVVEVTGASRAELTYRMQFAERYPTETELLNALNSFRSWREIVQALPRGEGECRKTPPIPAGRYATIAADPPWDFSADRRRSFARRGGETIRLAHPYPMMTVEEITAVPVAEYAHDDAHLYLWTTQRYLEASFSVARAWGFEPVKTLVWAKHPRGFNIGGTFQSATEFILFARRGKLPALRRVDRDHFDWPRPNNRHSAKPDGFFELVESVSPGPYLELFARRRRIGWTSWGDQLAASEPRHPSEAKTPERFSTAGRG